MAYKGGLRKWFKEDWRDVKTGKKCGRSGSKDKGRPYPACRPKKVAKRITKKEAAKKTGPKRALSAYFFFMAEQRKIIKEEKPDIKITEISKIGGERWGKLEKDKKKKFEDLAAKGFYLKNVSSYSWLII